MIDQDGIRYRWEKVGRDLNERGQRLFAAAEVRAAGVSDEAMVDAIHVAALFNMIVRMADGWRIRDCSSRTTRVNGQAIHDEPLKDGDVVQIGAFSFEAHLPAAPVGPSFCHVIDVENYAMAMPCNFRPPFLDYLEGKKY